LSAEFFKNTPLNERRSLIPAFVVAAFCSVLSGAADQIPADDLERDLAAYCIVDFCVIIFA
jgi:hypothetical protein